MAEDTIKVSFEADESSLAAAINAAKGQLASLDQALINTGQKLAGAFQTSGRDPASVFPMMAPENQQALAAYMATLDTAPRRMRQLTGATNELSFATDKMSQGFRVGAI